MTARASALITSLVIDGVHRSVDEIAVLVREALVARAHRQPTLPTTITRHSPPAEGKRAW